MDMITRTVKTTDVTITNTLTNHVIKFSVNGEKKDAVIEAQRHIKRNKLVGLAVISKIDDTKEKTLELPLSLFVRACKQYEKIKGKIGDDTGLLIEITVAEQQATGTETK